MATTSIGGDRKQGSALEVYTDAVFIRDDKKLFFGNGGDVSIEYDEDGNNVLAIAGANIRISDTQRLQFGDGSDVQMYWREGVSDVMIFRGLPTSNPGVANAMFTSDAFLKVSAG